MDKQSNAAKHKEISFFTVMSPLFSYVIEGQNLQNKILQTLYDKL